MEYVHLSNGVSIPQIGFGTYPLKGENLKSALSSAKNAGYVLFDTAYLYKNEKEIGEFLANSNVDRNSVFLTSKLQGIQYIGRKRFLYLDKVSVQKAYKHSCKRLHTDYLDLYMLHSPFTGYCQAYRELINLYEAGKVRAIGVSNFNVEELSGLRQNCGIFPLINQIEIHPFNSQKRIIEFCKENNIQVEAYSPFGRGEILNEIMNNGILKNIANVHNKTVGQVVLRWIVQQGVIAIPRSSNCERQKENLDVFDFELTTEEMSLIDSLNQDRGLGKHFNH